VFSATTSRYIALKLISEKLAQKNLASKNEISSTLVKFLKTLMKIVLNLRILWKRRNFLEMSQKLEDAYEILEDAYEIYGTGLVLLKRFVTGIWRKGFEWPACKVFQLLGNHPTQPPGLFFTTRPVFVTFKILQ
jgi:hypothetical protein